MKCRGGLGGGSARWPRPPRDLLALTVKIDSVVFAIRGYANGLSYEWWTTYQTNASPKSSQGWRRLRSATETRDGSLKTSFPAESGSFIVSRLIEDVHTVVLRPVLAWFSAGGDGGGIVEGSRRRAEHEKRERRRRTRGAKGMVAQGSSIQAASEGWRRLWRVMAKVRFPGTRRLYRVELEAAGGENRPSATAGRLTSAETEGWRRTPDVLAEPRRRLCMKNPEQSHGSVQKTAASAIVAQ
ncbi:hypothetical protein R3P38DRAFT_2758478 [Favolaschia claudopus]|uniref:Uncharacterized protein n=1 Tax=Favolaschia claudopus TaxID=2862362 RepID=A0AAW0EDG4_9AGAR